MKRLLAQIVLVGAFAIILFWAISFLKTREVFLTDDGAIDFNLELQYWNARIVSVGGAHAYRELGRVVDGVPELAQHLVAHAFGQALYEQAGWDGIGVCDTNFGQGCLHSFFGAAITENGVREFARLANDTCVSFSSASTQLSCQHAIGHGLLGYFGYTLSSLKEALAECNNLPIQRNRTIGCYGGALMEYNLRALERTTEPVRPFSEDVMFTPCSELPTHYQESCVFYQPSWWSGVLFRGVANASTTIALGGYCRQADTSELAMACFGGIGFLVPQRVRYDVQKTAELCAVFSSNEERLACWSYARPQLNFTRHDAPSEALCAGLGVQEKNSCVEIALGQAADIFNERGESELP